MKPIDYYRSLTTEEKAGYADRAETTAKYLHSHVFRQNGSSRRLSNFLVIRLAEASEGNVSLDEAIDYFLVQPVRQLADELSTVKPNSIPKNNATPPRHAGRPPEISPPVAA